MGFTKRYFSKEMILSEIKNGYPLSKLFKVDAFMFDDTESHTAYKLNKMGYTDKEIEEFLLSGINPLIEKK